MNVQLLLTTLLLLAYTESCVGRVVYKRQLPPSLIQPLCNIGPGPLNDSIIPSRRAQQDVVYVDTAHPITCTGRVGTVETCFMIDDSQSGGFSFNLVNIRPQGEGYIVQQALDIEPELNEDEVTMATVSCQNITVPSRFPVREGDLVGVRVWNSIEIAFAMFSYEGALSNVRVTPTLGIELVAVGLAEGELRLDSTTDYELPMLRTFIVADDDDDDGSGSPPPAPVNCPTTAPVDNAGNNPIGGGNLPGLCITNNYHITYSFLVGFIVAIVMTFVLSITVMGMGMSMCESTRKLLWRVCCSKKKEQTRQKNFKQLSIETVEMQ